ncbi:expressed unknown protein [Seminavis robusta]|uniref:Uncharacterized protein n=1 Tax=Seminavis robusta TaxID=568900 RepID=A0A9N8HF61_9STRA|nr:expressed unknown protein [Seminavis robusta]|eukprot:Sro419_g138991.1  (181) ;mRNA; r:14386-14928
MPSLPTFTCTVRARGVYGLCTSPKQLYQRCYRDILLHMELTPCKKDPCCFLGPNALLCSSFVDDCSYWAKSNKTMAWFEAELQNQLKLLDILQDSSYAFTNNSTCIRQDSCIIHVPSMEQDIRHKLIQCKEEVEDSLQMAEDVNSRPDTTFQSLPSGISESTVDDGQSHEEWLRYIATAS